MACKCIKKFVVVLMELLILLFLTVQANDLANISFYPSSPPIQFSYFSELDKVQHNVLAPISFSPSPLPVLYTHSSFDLDEVQETIHTCLENKIKICEETFEHKPTALKACIWLSHIDCMNDYHPKFTIQSSDIGSCFKECYEKHF